MHRVRACRSGPGRTSVKCCRSRLRRSAGTSCGRPEPSSAGATAPSTDSASPIDELSQTRPEVSGLFGGYAYLNASLNRVFGYRAPGMTASTVDDIYFGDHPDVPPVVIGDWWDSPRATAELEGWMDWVLTTTEQPDLEHDREVAEATRGSSARLRGDVEQRTDRSRDIAHPHDPSDVRPAHQPERVRHDRPRHHRRRCRRRGGSDT